MKGSLSTNGGMGHHQNEMFSLSSPKREQPSCLDISLTKCLQSIQQDVVKSQSAMETYNSSSKDLVKKQAAHSEGSGPDTEDISDSATPDSLDTNLTSSLDREVQRLQVLKTYLGVLNEDHGNKFERLTALACRIFRTPCSMVTIADLNNQYCISSRGLDIRSTAAMKLTFCSTAVASDCDLMVVEDSLKDERFCNDPSVTGFPGIRFYAGAPLLSPDGHRLGTMCVVNTEPRENPVTLDEKQSLIELAAMAMEYLEELRKKKQYAFKDPSQQIACTAHDLLTPLTGIALSISLLKEDEGLKEKLSEQQRDMIETAVNCSTVMNNICHKTMNFFRDQERSMEASASRKRTMRRPCVRRSGVPMVKTKDLVKNLNMVMDPFPKQVPMIITVEPDVPEEFISDDMKLFRSASNLLTNACTRTQTGSICMRIMKRANPESGEREIVFECEDTAPDIDVESYPYLFKGVRVEDETQSLDKGKGALEPCVSTFKHGAGPQYTGLGLYSVATQIDSMGGKYGFRPRRSTSNPSASASNECGSIFWFSIPLVLPDELVNPDSSGRAIPDQCSPTSLLASSTGKSSLSVDVAKRLSGLLGIEAPTSIEPKGSFNSLNKLSSEEALAAYASNSQLSNASSRNKRFREPEGTKRMNQALVIEDSLVVRKNLARVLTKLGFEVTQAVNGMEARGDNVAVSYFFDRAHDEFMSKLHEDFVSRYGVDIANIRMESFKIMDTELANEIAQNCLTTAHVENELSNLQGQSAIATQKEQTEATCAKIKAVAEAKRLQTLADAENKRRLDSAQADADSILLKAKAEAEAIRLKAVAEAERAKLLSETELGGQQSLFEIYAEMVKDSNKGVQKVVYMDPSSANSPFSIKSLDGLNRDLHSLTALGIAASNGNGQSGRKSKN